MLGKDAKFQQKNLFPFHKYLLKTMATTSSEGASMKISKNIRKSQFSLQNKLNILSF